MQVTKTNVWPADEKHDINKILHVYAHYMHVYISWESYSLKVMLLQIINS